MGEKRNREGRSGRIYFGMNTVADKRSMVLGTSESTGLIRALIGTKRSISLLDESRAELTKPESDFVKRFLPHFDRC